MSSKVYSKLDKIPTGRASDKIQQGCLVLEGGAFRGIYSQGVMDYWMKAGLNLECVIGVSAGALGGISYVAGQIGRSARANLGYRHNQDYIGLGALIKSRSPLRLDFLFQEFNEIEPINMERINSPLQRYIAVAANCKTGQAEYFEKGKCRDLFAAIKASASMPYVSPMVPVDGGLYLDGGCACKIPYQWALDQGFSKIVVLRTRQRDFRKKVSGRHPARKFYAKYPQFAQALDHSSADYNRQCQELLELERSGRIFVVAPSEPVLVKRVEGDMEKLGHLYWLGVRDAKKTLPALKAYLNS